MRDDRHPAHARWGVPDALVAAGVLLNLGVYVALGGVLWQDGANHAARYALIERAWFGTPAPWIRVVLLPAPYLGLDAIAAVLAHVVGAASAARTIGAVALSAPAIGLWLLLRRTAPALRAGALVGVLLGFSFYFLNGLLNYTIGIGAALAWVSVWWPRRVRCTAVARAGLAVGAAALYTLHLTAVCAALAVAAADLAIVVAVDVRTARRAGRPITAGAIARGHANRLATLAAVTGAVAVLWLALLPGLPPAPAVPDGVPVFRTLRNKVWTLTIPFYTLRPWELAATLPPYVLAIVGWWQAGRAQAVRARAGYAVAWRNPLAGAVLVLAGLYLVTPAATTAGFSLLDVRWLLPAALLAIAAASGMHGPDAHAPAGPTPVGSAPDGRRASIAPPRWAVGLLAAGCVAHAAVVLRAGREIGGDLADYDAVLAALPPDGRLVAVVAGAQRFARVDPRLHYAHWQTVRTGARVGGLFSYAYHAAGKPPAAYFHFAHFREVTPGWFPDEAWRVLGQPAIPWATVRRDYDYVVVAGVDTAATAAVRAGGGCLAAQRGAVAAYTTRPCATSGGIGADQAIAATASATRALAAPSP